MRRRLLLLPLLFLLPPAWAGHGLLNAFADIEWLPPPGRTPDQTGYALDRLAEQAGLIFCSDVACVQTIERYAREKLAELDAMVRADLPEPAAIAAEEYELYLSRAQEAIEALPAQTAQHAREKLVLELLAHQYIMSVDYLDLPRVSRTVIATAMAAAQTLTERLLSPLAASFRKSLFFKEEEIRWSWEMAQRADEQGL